MHNGNERAALQRIWDAHGLGAVRHIARPARGSINQAMIVNDALVIRFDVLGKVAGRFASEAAAYTTLRASPVPVPEVVVLDLTRTLSPHDFLIATKLPGTPVIDSWPDLSPAQRERVATQAGEYLALIHDHAAYDRFGHLRDLPGGGFASWHDFLSDYFMRYAAQALGTGALDEVTLQAVAAVLRAHQSLTNRVRHGALLHSDYHWENLLQQNGTITGIIDFEWAYSGDPTADFIVDDKWETMCPGSAACVLAGYTSVRALDPDHARKSMLYKLVLDVETCVDCAREHNVRQLAATRETLAHRLAALRSDT